jgi:hypothetical protein
MRFRNVLTKSSPEDPTPDLDILVSQMSKVASRRHINMKSQINDHPESIAGIDPRSTRFVAQSKKRVAHKQQSLYSRNIAVIERSSKQITHTVSKLPASSPDIRRHFAKLKPRAELRGSEIDGVQ